jgi:hypothetical protein
MSVYSCLDSIIGFTRKEDACVDVYNSSYSTSDSGLYIDELPGMSLRILGSTGGNSTLWEKMTRARENAINSFKVDVLREILKTKEPIRKKFIGDIGGKSFSSTVSDDTYHGLRMYSDIIGGTFTLRGVTLLLDTAEAVTLSVYTGPDDEDGGAAINTFNLTSLAGRAKYNAVTPTQFSLDGNLYFIYSTTGLPENNNLTCNCGGFKWCFDLLHPCYRYSRDKWTEWAMVAGIHGSDLSIRDDWGTSREARGLILHGDFGCDTLGILCSDHSDWTGDMVDSAIAWAILYKAGSFLSAYIMDSEEVNRYTLLGTEGLGANILFYETRYKEMIDFIAENIEDDRNECLKCKSPHGYKRQSQML